MCSILIRVVTIKLPRRTGFLTIAGTPRNRCETGITSCAYPRVATETTMSDMLRTIYDEDHEAFRSSVREFLDREVRPHLEEHLSQKALGREFWLAAGKQGFLGLEVPEEYGGAGAGDYRFNAVLLEELSHVNAALSSCV